MQKRYLMYKGVREHILVLAAKCHTPHTSVVAFNADGEEKDTTIHYGAMPVRLPEDPDFPGMHENYQTFRLHFVLRLWYHFLHLKVLLFAGARGVARGLDFQP